MASESLNTPDHGGQLDVFQSFSDDELRRLLRGRAMMAVNKPELADRLVETAPMLAKGLKQANPEWNCTLSELTAHLTTTIDAIKPGTDESLPPN
jgi:hypothetical protein